MISEAKKVELVAYVWNVGETPLEVSLSKDYFDGIQLKVQELLEDREFGKIVRRYDSEEVVLFYHAFTDEHRGRLIVSGIDEADLNKNFEARLAACALPVYSAEQLYAMTPTRVSYDLYHFVGAHVPEINIFDMDHITAEETKRIEIRQIAYDGRRTWELDTIWFDGKPVMVVNSSGRDGDEYSERFITDDEAYANMSRFLKSFVKEDGVTGFVKADAIIPAMTEFYGHTIHDFYDVVTQTAKKSLGNL